MRMPLAPFSISFVCGGPPGTPVTDCSDASAQWAGRAEAVWFTQRELTARNDCCCRIIFRVFLERLVGQGVHSLLCVRAFL